MAFKRFWIMLALVLALMVSFGCAKKSSGVAPENTGMSDGLSPEMRAAYATIQDEKIYFDFDKYNIKSEYQATLRQKAEVLKRYNSIQVLIEGNCDDRGTQEYNMALGERRARAAYEYLVQLGVSPSQLQMISYGSERPAAMGQNEQAWTQNRRDDFKIIN